MVSSEVTATDDDSYCSNPSCLVDGCSGGCSSISNNKKVTAEKKDEKKIFKAINDLKGVSEFMRDGFKGCYYDFLKRGVGYSKVYDDEFNLVMTKDLKELRFIVVLGFEQKILLRVKPSEELIKIYKRFML